MFLIKKACIELKEVCKETVWRSLLHYVYPRFVGEFEGPEGPTGCLGGGVGTRTVIPPMLCQVCIHGDGPIIRIPEVFLPKVDEISHSCDVTMGN